MFCSKQHLIFQQFSWQNTTMKESIDSFIWFILKQWFPNICCLKLLKFLSPVSLNVIKSCWIRDGRALISQLVWVMLVQFLTKIQIRSRHNAAGSVLAVCVFKPKVWQCQLNEIEKYCRVSFSKICHSESFLTVGAATHV